MKLCKPQVMVQPSAQWSDGPIMYGLAYVLLTSQHTSLQDLLDRSLARFHRGNETELPPEFLEFHDETEELAEMHRCRIRYDNGMIQADAAGTAHADVLFHLDRRKLNDHLAACRLMNFEGAFAELEPDFDAFVRCFANPCMLDPTTKRYGRLLNPFARWDWWELGGRFNGIITGEARPAGNTQRISSGGSIGRSSLNHLTRALGIAPNTQTAAVEFNVELVDTMRLALLSGEAERLPSALVLPYGACADEARWIDDPAKGAPHPAAMTLLGVSPTDDFRTIIGRAYDRFAPFTAAGVAYHF
jgi:hypothetical protein